MADLIANFFLYFSHISFIAPFLVIGLFTPRREVFYTAARLLLFSIISNIALKVTFEVPLNPLLGKEGYAFPSGHMQSATILYSYLIQYSSKNFIKALYLVLIIGIGSSLIYFNYHDLCDVLGGIFFALLILHCFNLIASRSTKFINLFSLVLPVAMILYIYLHQGRFYIQPLVVYFSLLGITYLYENTYLIRSLAKVNNIMHLFR